MQNKKLFYEVITTQKTKGTPTKRDFGVASALVTYWFCTCLTNRLRTWDNYR